MLRALFIMFLFPLPFSSIGQSNNCTIDGKIVNENGEAIPFAGITLLRKSDTINCTKSNLNGHFTFRKIKSGNYRILTLSVGYQPKQDSLIVKSSETCKVSVQIKKYGGTRYLMIMTCDKCGKKYKGRARRIHDKLQLYYTQNHECSVVKNEITICPMPIDYGLIDHFNPSRQIISGEELRQMGR